MVDENPGKEDYVSFVIDGVKLRDIEAYDKLAGELISNRAEPMKRRKDAFYFSLFHLKQIHDVVSTIRESIKEEILEELRECGLLEKKQDDKT